MYEKFADSQIIIQFIGSLGRGKRENKKLNMGIFKRKKGIFSLDHLYEEETNQNGDNQLESNPKNENKDPITSVTGVFGKFQLLYW